LDVSEGRAASLAFVGEGEIPPDFDRVNWAAYGFGFFWALVYGPRRWAYAIVTAFLLPIVIDTIALVLFDSNTVYPVVQGVTASVSAVVLPLVAGAYALVVNRQLWNRERERFDAGELPSGVIPLERYLKSTRRWSRVFVFLVALVLILSVYLLTRGRLALVDVRPGFGAVVMLGLFVYDRVRLRRRS
jgi:hypothetical protein